MGSTLYSNRYNPKFGRNRKVRPKTFKSEEAAKKYAEEAKISDYTVEQLSATKFRINQ